MLKRIITAVVALAVFVPVLYFSQTFIFPIVISLLSTVACYEMLKCIKLDKSYLLAIPCLIAAAAIPILARYLPAAGFTIFLALFCIIIAISVFGFKKYDVGTLSIVFYELFLVIFGFFSIVLLRDAEPYKYLLIFIAAWGTDTFAYFSGYFLGKRKLCPDISPKKTIAGAIGGIIGCVFGFVLFGLVLNTWFGGTENLLVLALTAIPLSIMGQIGDLSASLIKRRFAIKDYGNIFPGHGGVLDRFDSILPISIIFYAITLIF